MRKTLYSKTSLQVIIPLACSISAAMMLDQGFSIHHEAHKGHEDRTTGLQHAILFLRALRVLRGGILRMKYQQLETLHQLFSDITPKHLSQAALWTVHVYPPVGFLRPELGLTSALAGRYKLFWIQNVLIFGAFILLRRRPRA